MARLVLTDASPLIGLARVDGLGWLESLFDVVALPPRVRDEVLPGRGGEDERMIAAGLDAGWLKVHRSADGAAAAGSRRRRGGLHPHRPGAARALSNPDG
jgi:predicted nucleic acid-binding protein